MDPFHPLDLLDPKTTHEWSDYSRVVDSTTRELHDLCNVVRCGVMDLPKSKRQRDFNTWAGMGLRVAREMTGATQPEYANHLYGKVLGGVAPGFRNLGKYERGENMLPAAVLIAAATDVDTTVDDILDEALGRLQHEIVQALDLKQRRKLEDMARKMERLARDLQGSGSLTNDVTRTG